MATNNSRLRYRRCERAAGQMVWPATADGALRTVATRARRVVQAVRQETLQEGVYLVPVRAFIGIGWLRAFAEKAIDPGWRDGTRLMAFLEHQLDAGRIVVPPYQALVTDVFLSHALTLAWIVTLGQLLAGIAIASGTLTTAALLGGIFMNLNFLLAGAPDPSAFYIVIQAALWLSGAGTILGVDAWIAARQLGHRPSPAFATPVATVLASLSIGIVVYAVAHIRDWTPAGSVHDPAAVLAVLAAMAATWFTVLALRGDCLSPAAGGQRSHAERSTP